MRVLACIVIFAAAVLAKEFDILEYIQMEHDKLFFGAGGGSFTGLNETYREYFPRDYSPLLILQAGAGDYPFAFDVKYCVQWSEGFSAGMVSGRGAKLTEYQIIPGARVYLFWKNPRLKSRFVFGVVASQEEMVSATSAATDQVDATDGIRFGFCAGLGLDVFPAQYCFFDLDLVYKYVPSDFFEKKELLLLTAVFNIGQ